MSLWLPPRCGRPMRRYAMIWGPGPRLSCGRPAGHNGPCRSTDAVRNYYRQGLERQQDTRRNQAVA